MSLILVSGIVTKMFRDVLVQRRKVRRGIERREYKMIN